MQHQEATTVDIIQWYHNSKYKIATSESIEECLKFSQNDLIKKIYKEDQN